MRNSDYGKAIRDAYDVLDSYANGNHDAVEHERARIALMDIIQSYANMGMYDYRYYCEQLNNIDNGNKMVSMMEWTATNPMN